MYWRPSNTSRDRQQDWKTFFFVHKTGLATKIRTKNLSNIEIFIEKKAGHTNIFEICMTSIFLSRKKNKIFDYQNVFISTETQGK